MTYHPNVHGLLVQSQSAWAQMNDLYVQACRIGDRDLAEKAKVAMRAIADVSNDLRYGDAAIARAKGESK